MSTCRGLNLAIATAVQHTLLDVLVLFIEAVFGRKDLSGVPGTPRMCRKSGRRAPVGGKKMASRIHCRLTRTEGHRSPPFTGHRSPVIGHRETNTKLIIGITFRFGAFLLQHYSSIFVIHHEVRIYSGRGLGENTRKKVIDTCTVLMEKTRETQLLHSLTNLLHLLSFQLAGARR